MREFKLLDYERTKRLVPYISAMLWLGVLIIIGTFTCSHGEVKPVFAAPQSYTLQLTGTPPPLVYAIGEWTGSIWDDTALTAPPNPTSGEIGIFLFCSPSGDHYLTWPENFVSTPPATLRKSTCVSAEFIYDSNAQMWFPVSQPMIFESAARP